MNLATRILWEAANTPEGEGNEEGDCRICGLSSCGLSFSEWVRPTFTDWDKILPGEIICQACQFSFCERSELLTKKVGKENLQRMRNYSHFVVDGQWVPLSKADKVRMQDILLHDNPSIAIIAESGQKHIIFRAIPGVVQFEEQRIYNWRDLDTILGTVEELYTRFSKEEIASGRYRQYLILDFGIGRWNGLERAIRPLRQTPLFALSLFLAQREEIEKDGDTRSDDESVEGNMERSTGRLQEPLPGFDMAAIRG